MEKVPGFMLYLDAGQQIEQLSDAQAGRVIKAVYRYADTGEVPSLSKIESIVFFTLRGQVDRSIEKYTETRERNRINGEKGGAPIGNQNARKQPKTTDSTQWVEKQPEQANCNVTETKPNSNVTEAETVEERRLRFIKELENKR